MLLCIDIGNTNIMIGVYENEELGPRWRLSTDHDRMPDEFAMQLINLLAHADLTVQDITDIAIASGVPVLTSRWTRLCQRYFEINPMIVSGRMETGLTILYDNPNSVGADRVVDAAAAYNLYGGPLCIVDFGTATTFEAITAAGEYLGGAISPGIGVSAEALSNRAARLPAFDIERPPSVIGRNTIHSLQSGLLFGYVSLVEGMISRFMDELGANTTVIATGGLSSLIAAETDMIDIISPWLTLDGLRMVYELNSEIEF